ncbi:MAG TPA: metallophosphoesterase family protein [Candidatus Paceibacterota bacterium]
MQTTLVLPDIQYPFHDALMLKKILQVVKDVKPDKILSIGDAIDFPQVSRWSVGTAGFYATTLQEHVEGFRRDVLVPLREVAPAATITWLEGNHDVRLKEFVTKYAPALRVLDALKMESLFGLDDLNIKYSRGPERIATNTIAVHGHEAGGYASTPQAWDSKWAKRYGTERNVIFGHTHQPFITTRATGYSGKVSPWFTMNVGSIMDPTHATYVKDGAVSWVMSFALLRDDGKRVWPELILANNRQFYLEGRKY